MDAKPSILERLKSRSRELRIEIRALSLAYRDARVPWYARLFIVLVVAYAVSPIDLIPDFIPVLGYLDDLVIVPLGIFLALKMIPPAVMKEARDKARQAQGPGGRFGWAGAGIVLLAWCLVLAGMVGFFLLLLKK